MKKESYCAIHPSYAQIFIKYRHPEDTRLLGEECLYTGRYDTADEVCSQAFFTLKQKLRAAKNPQERGQIFNSYKSLAIALIIEED